jgi:hypothetical protein
VTGKDFLLSILASIIAAKLIKWSREGLVFLQTRVFPKIQVQALITPIAITHALVPIAIIITALALAPKSLAPNEPREILPEYFDLRPLIWGSEFFSPPLSLRGRTVDGIQITIPTEKKRRKSR